MGELPDATPQPASDDPARLVNLVAHAVARAADRVTFLRRFSRHLEGTERRAGILSDMTAAGWELYKRNPDAVERLGRSFLTDLRERRQAKSAAATNGAPPTHTTGGIHNAAQ